MSAPEKQGSPLWLLKTKLCPYGPDLICASLVVILSLFAGLPRYLVNLDLGDEGLLAYGAVRVTEGQVPNRDFVSLHPPLGLYTAALTFKLFGTSLASLRIVGLGIYVLIPLLIYGCARILNRPVLSLAAALPAMVLGISFAHFVPVSAWQAVTASLAAALMYLVATCSTRALRYLAFPAGLLTGATVLLRQDQGFYLTISILAYTVALRFAGARWNAGVLPYVGAEGQVMSGGVETPCASQLPNNVAPEDGCTPMQFPKAVSSGTLKATFGFWAAGLLSVLIGFAIYWLSVGALPAVFQQLVLFPLTTYSRTSSLPFPSLRTGLTFGSDAAILLYYVPPLIVLFAGISLGRCIIRRSFDSREAVLAFLVVWSGLFYCQVLVRSDMDHLLITLPPFFILSASLFGRLLEFLRARLANRSASSALLSRRLLCVVPAIVALGFLLLVKPEFLPAPIEAKETLSVPRGGVRKLGAGNLKKFVERVQQYAPPDRSILCLPYQPMFYFLCERRNPTRWNYLWPGDQTTADHQALLDQARRDPPAVIIITGEPAMESYARDILAYVHSEYRLAANAGGMFLLYLPVGVNTR